MQGVLTCSPASPRRAWPGVGQTVDDARPARRNPAGTLGTGNGVAPDPGLRGACDRHHTNGKPQTNETRGDIPMSTLPIARILTLTAVGSLWLAAGGHAVTITATLDPAGPIQVNDEFDVDLRSEEHTSELQSL